MNPALLVASIFLFSFAHAQTPDPSMYSGLKWRSIGPPRGGRSVACSGVPGKPNDFYMGTTGGGLWKTTNAGVDWACVSDGIFTTGSVGAIGVSPSQPETVYVGMGETDIRGNITHGDGVYKTTDGGETWANVGLRTTQYISRVRVHPKDPNIAYVGVLGHIYGPSRERGLYKTTDGGFTWSRVLDGPNDRSGVIEVAMDPNKDPETLYVATWEALAHPLLAQQWRRRKQDFQDHKRRSSLDRDHAKPRPPPRNPWQNQHFRIGSRF